jgi:hypothetical protein
MNYDLGDLIKVKINNIMFVGKIIGIFRPRTNSILSYHFMIAGPLVGPFGSIFGSGGKTYIDEVTSSCNKFIKPSVSDILQFRYVPIYAEEVISRL